MTDGICSSVLEALYLGIPVVAAENDNRPEQVVTYTGDSKDDVSLKVREVLQNPEDAGDKSGTIDLSGEDSVEELVDIVLRNRQK